MKCDICGRETKINWGDARSVICEQCSSSASGIKDSARLKDEAKEPASTKISMKRGKGYIWLILICFLFGIATLWLLDLIVPGAFSFTDYPIIWGHPALMAQKLAVITGQVIVPTILGLIFGAFSSCDKRKRTFLIAFPVLFGMQIFSTIYDYKEKEPPKNLEAARFFEGYYLVKTRAIYDFCQTKGVDISGYIEAYNKIEIRPYNMAKSILQENGEEFGASYEGYSKYFIQAAEKQIERTSKLIAKQLDNPAITSKDICMLFRDADDEYLGTYIFEKDSPKEYKELMGAD